METSEKTTPPFLHGGGEMGGLIRNHDWSLTSVGSPGQWPQPLRITVSNLLRSGFPMFLWWGEDMIQFYNDAYRPSLGDQGKHPSALGQKGKECWPEIWDSIYPMLEQVKVTGEATWMEDQLLPIYRNGKLEHVYWTYSYSAVLDENGCHAGILVICMETTKKVRDLKQQQDRENDLRSVILQAPVAMCIFRGPDHVIEIANDLMFRFWGKPAEQVMHKSLFTALPEAANQGFEELLAGVLRTGERFAANELTVTLPRNGQVETVYINFAYEPVREADGSISRILAMATDVSDQVLARKKVEEAEERVRLSLLAAGLGSFEVNLLTFEVITSARFDSIFGADHSNEHEHYVKYIHPDDQQLREQAYRTAQQTGVLEYEARVVWKDGSMHWVRMLGNIYYDEARKPIRMLGVAQDITERKKVEDELRNTAERLQLALEAGQLGSYELELSTGDIVCTPQCKHNYGLAASDSFNFEKLLSLILPSDREGMQKAVAKAVDEKGLFNAEYRIQWPGGSKIRWIRAVGLPIYTPQGQGEKIVGITLDITEQKEFAEELGKQVRERTIELEEKNRELERSNTNLEEFAYAASHDLKEPIRKIHYFTARLKGQLASRLQNEESSSFASIERSTERMNALIDDLLVYSHVSQRPHEKESVDLNKKLQQVLEDLELDIQDKKATVHSTSLPQISGYRRQLQQLFHNLITNALKYSRPSIPPQINISSSLISGKEAGLSTEGMYHCIEVKDNGIGFEQEYAEKIFHMFTRLHGRSEYSGTGVGLSIAKKVVENHNGRLSAKGTPGQGAVFSIYLPVDSLPGYQQ